jgi:hypothetical protein
MNECEFSPCRRWRYVLTHRFDGDMFGSGNGRVVWICLNPSTADEQRLDPTIRRIRAFSKVWGFSSFSVLNLFGWRATKPSDMFRAAGYGAPTE